LGHREGDFPVAERLQSEVVSLPLYPGLAEDDVRYVAEVINGENW
jgi:dTDP-4-amino-4,6-dideoxygalactose transaminase